MEGLSIITATHGRAPLVRALLESLAAERRSVDFPTEAILVDSSPPDEAGAIAAACGELDAVYHYHPHNNVRQKRNLAINAARYDLLLFIDSDCQAQPGLLGEHYHTLRADERTGGVIGVTRFVGPDSPVFRLIEKTSLLDAFAYAERHAHVPWGPTCNISYRKTILTDVGLFDESFPFRLGGDDTDLGLRVTDRGHAIVSNPRAIVWHTKATWNGAGLIARRVFRWGRMHFHLMRKHPGRVYYDFPTLSGIFMALCLAALVLGRFVSPWAGAALLLWLPTELLIESLLVTRVLGYPWRQFLYVLGARLLSLWFEVGTLLEAARYRSALPLLKEITYTPPSLAGRYRRVAQLWAIVLTLLILALAGLWWQA